MYGTTAAGLRSIAYNHGCVFARNHPAGNRLLVLDFGAARKLDADTWGVVDFSGVRFGNPDVLAALKASADGHHNCWNGTGTTIVAYGNSNYRMSSAGLTTTDAWWAGYYQARRSQDLQGYQTANGYSAQSAAAASDMEPAWDGQMITKQLVNGSTAQGWPLYYDYGSADGCPASGTGGPCTNGWDVGDVAYVSYHGLAVPLPEIYYRVQADQWTLIRRWWNANAPTTYRFFGTTGDTGTAAGHLTPAEGWTALNTLNPGVLPEVICFGC
jgi:hypothetical protein